MNIVDVVMIKDITIKISGKAITVTLDEARKLKAALDEIFPAQIAPVQIHYNNEPYKVTGQPYLPFLNFYNETITGGIGTNTCSAILDIEPEGNIIS